MEFITVIISYNAFALCDSISSMAIPDSVMYIGNDTFNGCDSLKSVTLGDSVTSISVWAFDSCYSLLRNNYTGTVEQ